MDKRDYFLTIITTTILICLVLPTVTYILLPLAVILIYAVNLYHKSKSVEEDQPPAAIDQEDTVGNHKLDYQNHQATE